MQAMVAYNDTPKGVLNRIREQRKRAGLTIEALAERCGRKIAVALWQPRAPSQRSHRKIGMNKLQLQ